MNTPKLTTNISESEFEKLLIKIIIQFSLYSQGLENKLDPHLAQLKLQLKSGFDKDKLRDQLLSLSNTLSELCQTSLAVNKQHPELLFDYLKLFSTEPETLESLEHIQQQYQHKEFNSSKSLFDALSTLSLIPKADNAQDFFVNQPDAPKEFFLTKLHYLLQNIEIPAQFSNAVAQLKQRTNQSLTDEDYKKVIADSLQLLLNIKKHTEKEQHGIEQFLAEISSQLNQVEKHALTATQSNLNSFEDRNAFANDLSLHVENIKNTSSSAYDLSSLQLNINNHLSELTSKLDEHKQSELIRQQETQSQLTAMTMKLQDMESEAANLRSSLQAAHSKAIHDPLTNLPNRLAYNERLELELARWKRYREPLSMLIWDIDHFKLINDDFGHKSGDKTLILIAKLLSDNSRETDFTARYGGEEFVTLLPNTTAEGALIVANKIRQIISETGFHANGRAIGLTISCGISEFKENDTPEAVFERADQALYQAKQQGRNCCKIF